MSKYKKPNHYPAVDIVATKSGWAYTKNSNEVLSAIANLDAKLAAEEEAAVVKVTSVSLGASTDTLIVGGTRVLKPTILPEDATDKTVTWSSNKTNFATVVNGVVTAVAEGTAIITATSVSDPTKKSTVTFTVTAE